MHIRYRGPYLNLSWFNWGTFKYILYVDGKAEDRTIGATTNHVPISRSCGSGFQTVDCMRADDSSKRAQLISIVRSFRITYTVWLKNMRWFIRHFYQIRFGECGTVGLPYLLNWEIIYKILDKISFIYLFIYSFIILSYFKKLLLKNSIYLHFL